VLVPSGKLGRYVPAPGEAAPTLEYNEYIVYHPAQQRPRFLVDLAFE
jgi:hypothetical protein